MLSWVWCHFDLNIWQSWTVNRLAYSVADSKVLLCIRYIISDDIISVLMKSFKLHMNLRITKHLANEISIGSDYWWLTGEWVWDKGCKVIYSCWMFLPHFLYISRTLCVKRIYLNPSMILVPCWLSTSTLICACQPRCSYIYLYGLFYICLLFVSVPFSVSDKIQKICFLAHFSPEMPRDCTATLYHRELHGNSQHLQPLY